VETWSFIIEDDHDEIRSAIGDIVVIARRIS
jgi:hypothetical protein